MVDQRVIFDVDVEYDRGELHIGDAEFALSDYDVARFSGAAGPDGAERVIRELGARAGVKMLHPSGDVDEGLVPGVGVYYEATWAAQFLV